MRTTDIRKRVAGNLLVLTLGLGTLAAAPPKKQPIGRYVTLWTQSPFTVPPPPPVTEDGPGPLEDYVLTGVSKMENGYFVVLMNKKKRDERIRIAPGDENKGGFKVVKVTQDPYDYKLTKVEISVGGSAKTGTVTYDEKFLSVKTPSPAAQKTGADDPRRAGPPPTIPGMTRGTPAPTPTPTPAKSSEGPRVRRLPTPAGR